MDCHWIETDVGRCHAYICWSYTVLDRRPNSMASRYQTGKPASSAGLVAVAHAGNDDKRLLVKNVDSGQ